MSNFSGIAVHAGTSGHTGARRPQTASERCTCLEGVIEAVFHLSAGSRIETNGARTGRAWLDDPAATPGAAHDALIQC
jgi:hypothetical protein